MGLLNAIGGEAIDGSRGDTLGFADDYAYLIHGLLNMYEATFDDSYLQFADQLQSKSQISYSMAMTNYSQDI